MACGGYYCGPAPIMEHGFILFDTKPIEGEIVLQGHSLSSYSMGAAT